MFGEINGDNQYLGESRNTYLGDIHVTVILKVLVHYVVVVTSRISVEIGVRTSIVCILFIWKHQAMDKLTML